MPVVCTKIRPDCTLQQFDRNPDWPALCKEDGCSVIVEQCRTAGPIDAKTKEEHACTRIDGNHCSAYRHPKVAWQSRRCPLAARRLVEEKTTKVNPLKASKRDAKAKKK